MVVPARSPGEPLGQTRTRFGRWAAIGIVAATSMTGGCDRDGGADSRTPEKPAANGPERSKEAAPTSPPRVSLEAFSEAMLSEARDRDYAANPALLDRVRASPHAFFRSVNRSFSDSVCAAFADWVQDAPEVNLHGDAHLEQYAVSDEGRGLTDFDDATRGPPVVDMARLATSVALAARRRGWDPDPLLDALERGYRRGLMEPQDRPPTPALVARVRRQAHKPKAEALAEAEALMVEISPEDRRGLVEGIGRYGAERREVEPDLADSYFRVKHAGALQLGIGSALSRKYLFRVEGPTAAPDDDLLLEAKEVRPLDGISCVHTAQAGNPLRILIASTRLAYQPYAHVGYYVGADRNFWIHAWQTNYRELSVDPGTPASPRTREELAEVVFDAGFQLGRGHPNHVGAPLEEEVRRYLSHRVGRQARLARERLDILVAAVESAYRRFVAGLDDG